MGGVKRLYNRVDKWTWNLPRLHYAAFVGAVSALSYLLVGTLFGGSVTIEALTMGLTLAFMLYVFNTNQQT